MMEFYPLSLKQSKFQIYDWAIKRIKNRIRFHFLPRNVKERFKLTERSDYRHSSIAIRHSSFCFAGINSPNAGIQPILQIFDQHKKYGTCPYGP